MKEVDPSDIDRRLRREGARYGDIRVSLIWGTVDDLDLQVRGMKSWFSRHRCNHFCAAHWPRAGVRLELLEQTRAAELELEI